MPRRPREKSENGIYHIMLRGINQQTIFEEDEDYMKFLSTLEKYKAVSGYRIFAYCLMSNHIHILLKIEDEDIDVIMKRIAGSYVYWYNWKYYRKGHLFQDRFKSEVVKEESNFLAVLRYIHQNLKKAGEAKNLDDYKYSSYNEYIEEKGGMVDKNFVFSILPRERFEEFNKKENEDKCLDIAEEKFRISDRDAGGIIKQISKCSNATEFQRLSEKDRDKNIKKLKEQGLSIRQISRLTGISKGVVEKV